tara:strand:+ start:196 stop:786 length:591 start_codon:yes stop_codon:yes gene_type:complete
MTKTAGFATALAFAGAVGLAAGAALAHGPGMMGDRDDMPHRGAGMMSQDSQNTMPMMGGYGMMGGGYQGGMPMMGPGMMGSGMMGYGMMGGGYQGGMPMMGPGMMGAGMMGPGMMSGCGHGMGMGGAQPLRSDLTADEVEHMMEHRVAWANNPNLKVGTVKATDDDTIEADIVTKDGSLVRKFKIDRHTGRMQPVQ